MLLLLGASLVLAGVGGVVLSSTGGRAARIGLVGLNVPVNPGATDPSDISAHNSPTLVRDPTRPANLAVSSRIDTPFFSCSLDVSHDGGASWSQTPIPAPAGQQAKCYAPDVAYSRNGLLYVEFVTLAGNGNTPDAVWLSTSRDDGRTLSTPERILGANAFQVRLAADPVRPGRLVVTWLQALGDDLGQLKFTSTGNPIEAMRSDDYGATWTSPVRVSSPARARVIAPSPVVADNGVVYVAYVDLGQDKLDYEGEDNGFGGPPYQGPYTLVVARSVDGGAHWGESVVDARIVPITRFVVFLPHFPSIAAAPDGWVYVAYEDGGANPSDVDVWSLAPGAAGWHGPARLNDPRLHDGTYHYLPALAVARDGRLDVLYYDRVAPANVFNDVALQSSFDHARTFTRAVRLSSTPFSSQIGYGAREGMPDLGSRLALISGNTFALGVWTDTRAGTPATQKQDIAEQAVAIRGPQGPSTTAKDALRFGGIALVLAGMLLLGFSVSVGRRRQALSSTEARRSVV